MRLLFLLIVAAGAMATVGFAVVERPLDAPPGSPISVAPSVGDSSVRGKKKRRGPRSEATRTWSIDAAISRELSNVTSESAGDAVTGKPRLDDLRALVRDAASADRADPGDVDRLRTAIFARVLQQEWRDDEVRRRTSVRRVTTDRGSTLDLVDATVRNGEVVGVTSAGIRVTLPVERAVEIDRNAIRTEPLVDAEQFLETAVEDGRRDADDDDDSTVLLLRAREAWTAGRGAEYRERLASWMQTRGPERVAIELRHSIPELQLAVEIGRTDPILPELRVRPDQDAPRRDGDGEPTILDLDGIEAELAVARRDFRRRDDQEKLIGWIRRVDDWTYALESMITTGRDTRGNPVAKKNAEALLQKVRLFHVDANRKFGF